MEALRQEIAEVYAKQKKTLADGSFFPPKKRIEALKKLEASVRRHEKELIQAMIDDFNKPELEIVETETALVLSELKHTIRHLRRWARPKRVQTPIHQIFTTSRIYREPYGTVLVMSPWNYPFQLLMMPALSALAAGNTVVLRPSTQTRRTAEVTAEIFKEALPPELAYVVLCDSSKADVLLEFQWDFLFFTGSRAVGISIYRYSGAGRKIAVHRHGECGFEIRRSKTGLGKDAECGTDVRGARLRDCAPKRKRPFSRLCQRGI